MAETPEAPHKPRRLTEMPADLVNRVDTPPPIRDQAKGPKTGVPKGATREPYSQDVSAVAFGDMKKELGIDLMAPEKWLPTTDEHRWWTQAMPAAYAHRDDLPKGVEIKAKASIGNPEPVNTKVGTHLTNTGEADALYLGGSMNVLDTWDAKAKRMPAFDQGGRPLKGASGTETYFDSVYKDGKVFNVDGQTVLQSQDNPQSGLRTFLIPNPGNLGGVDTTKYAQAMVDKALAKGGQAGKIEFPMYDQTVNQNLDGLHGLSAIPTIGKDGLTHRFSIDQAEMTSIFQANEKGQRSYERQGFGSRGIEVDNDPPATRMSRPFIVAQVSPGGRVFMSAAINPANYKRPTIEGIDK